MILLINSILSLICTILLSIFKYHISDITKIYIPIIIFIVCFILLPIVELLFCAFVSIFPKKNKEFNKKKLIYKFTLDNGLRLLVNYSGARIKYSGLNLIPKNEKFLIVTNHMSNFDPIIACSKLAKNNMIAISKQGNFDIPVAGGMMRSNCYIAIDRESPREALKTIIKVSDYIKDGKFSVYLNPEGTRNKEDVTKLLPFKSGAFKIAFKAKCPIVIAEVYNTCNIHKNFPFKKTKVEFNVLKVLSYDEYKDSNTTELGDYVRNLIQSKIDERILK